ncbi:MAG: DUF4377 domain-containing protein [Cruoricaptor ignavus]|nr:DUF4377 domain-containing protein [Cruoricaptor ignavus]
MTNLMKMLMLVIIPLALVSCLLDDTPKDKVSTEIVSVAAETEWRLGTIVPSSELINLQYMFVTLSNGQTESWRVSKIRGFEHEEGYEYRLSLKKTILAEPPADGSNTVYELLDVISKVKKNNSKY